MYTFLTLPRRLKDSKILYDYTPDAIFYQRDIEVNQEAKPLLRESEMTQDLSHIHWMHLIGRF
jgi:hypothetical protein